MPSITARPKLPRLLRHLALSLAIGVTVGMAFALMLLAMNVSQIRDLVFGSSDPVLALVMLLILNALTFGSLAMGTGIMHLPWHDGDDAAQSSTMRPVDRTKPQTQHSSRSRTAACLIS